MTAQATVTTPCEPDLELSRRFLGGSDPPGRVILCSVTGSHYYGFPSPDSDIDLKGIYLAPTAMFLGLTRAPEGYDLVDTFEGVEFDLTLTEARQALDLLLRGNGNMLERIMSPYQLLSDSDELEPLRELALGSISKKFYRHYHGFFRGTCREHERTAKPRAKTLLYAYRVALTGIHLLKSGELEADLRKNAVEYGYHEALELADFKQEAGEKAIVSPEEDRLHRGNWARLGRDLELAHGSSELPEQANNTDACAQWLIELRLMAFERAEAELGFGPDDPPW
ncbi:MAG: nucleotidyltransferase domain-containing protein [Nannocystaceae bacterium]|nr:nucleotidyltransferase domain-containing protein [Myxococcales bacterium]